MGTRHAVVRRGVRRPSGGAAQSDGRDRAAVERGGEEEEDAPFLCGSFMRPHVGERLGRAVESKRGDKREGRIGIVGKL